MSLYFIHVHKVFIWIARSVEIFCKKWLWCQHQFNYVLIKLISTCRQVYERDSSLRNRNKRFRAVSEQRMTEDEILGFCRARNETRAKKRKEGGGWAFPSFLPHPLPAYSLHFLRGLCFPVFDSRNSTETLATQASEIARALANYGTENAKRRTSRKSSEDSKSSRTNGTWQHPIW